MNHTETTRGNASLPPPSLDVAVLILFFNRPSTLQPVFEQVRKARPAKLFLYQDGPRGERDMPGIEACRDIVSHVDWDCEVKTFFQEQNVGCDPSEYISQKWAFSYVDKCIVLEDDDVPSLSFFPFCKEMLDRYADDRRISIISGFNHEEHTTDVGDASYFFSTTHSIWGWASWRRVLDEWDEHYTFLDDPVAMSQLRALVRERHYRDDFIPMCERHRELGKAFYETIFQAQSFLGSGLSIVPVHNLITNLGVQADSTHFAGSVDTLPKGYRRIFTMGRHELTFPLHHPRYVVEHVAYRQRVYRIMGWGHPWLKVMRSLEELWLNLRYGNFTAIFSAAARRVRKWITPKSVIH